MLPVSDAFKVPSDEWRLAEMRLTRMLRRTARTLRPIPGYEVMDKGICGRGVLLLDLCHVGRATDIEGSGSGEAKSGGGKDDVGDHEGHEGKGPAVELEQMHGSRGGLVGWV